MENRKFAGKAGQISIEKIAYLQGLGICGKGTTYIMDVKQLRNLLKFGRTRTVVTYCALCIDYIGYVKIYGEFRLSF